MAKKGDIRMDSIEPKQNKLGYERSEAIGKLSLALSKAQASMGSAIRDADNPFFKSKYADLASVWKACRKELTDNELSIIQLPIGKPPSIGLITILSHSSGQFISSSFFVETKKNDPQSAGSAISYLKRYALSAMVGIATDGEDDDGNAAAGKQPQGNQNQQRGQQRRQQPVQNIRPQQNRQQQPRQNNQAQPQNKSTQIINAFSEFGIGISEIEKFANKPIASLDDKDRAKLLVYYNEVKSKLIKI